jgi:hypothetical protein
MYHQWKEYRKFACDSKHKRDGPQRTGDGIILSGGKFKLKTEAYGQGVGAALGLMGQAQGHGMTRREHGHEDGRAEEEGARQREGGRRERSGDIWTQERDEDRHGRPAERERRRDDRMREENVRYREVDDRGKCVGDRDRYRERSSGRREDGGKYEGDRRRERNGDRDGHDIHHRRARGVRDIDGRDRWRERSGMDRPIDDGRQYRSERRHR